MVTAALSRLVTGRVLAVERRAARRHRAATSASVLGGSF